MVRAGALAGAVALMLGAAACGVPNTAASQPSGISSAVVAASSVGARTAPASNAPIESAPASSPVASSRLPAPVGAEPSKLAGPLPADVGDLAQFTQVSATTWWATVVGNLTNGTFVVRTVDGGRTWQDVTPPVDALRSNDDPISDVLSAQTAWLEAATSDAAAPIPLYRTRDGGQSWQDIGSVPVGCDLQFVDLTRGWCSTLVGAAGSMPVDLYSTLDGGATWRLISQTTGDGTPSTPDALPFGCDKSLTFTPHGVGWASSFCAGGGPYLEISTDGGARWHAVTPPPFPATADASEGEGLSIPVVSGEDVAIADLGALGPGGSAIDTSSDNGKSWRIHPLPTAPSNSYWNVDLVDPTHWRATDGDVIISTDDAGAHWQRWTPDIAMHDQFGTLNLDFISPDIGTASDPANHSPLWSTTDGGKTWTRVAILAGPYVVK